MWRMNKRILVIQGHPDPDSTHFGHALADAYVQSARAAGHTVEGDAGKRRDWLAGWASSAHRGHECSRASR